MLHLGPRFHVPQLKGAGEDPPLPVVRVAPCAILRLHENAGGMMGPRLAPPTDETRDRMDNCPRPCSNCCPAHGPASSPPRNRPVHGASALFIHRHGRPSRSERQSRVARHEAYGACNPPRSATRFNHPDFEKRWTLHRTGRNTGLGPDGIAAATSSPGSYGRDLRTDLPSSLTGYGPVSAR